MNILLRKKERERWMEVNEILEEAIKTKRSESWRHFCETKCSYLVDARGTAIVTITTTATVQYVYV